MPKARIKVDITCIMCFNIVPLLQVSDFIAYCKLQFMAEHVISIRLQQLRNRFETAGNLHTHMSGDLIDYDVVFEAL